MSTLSGYSGKWGVGGINNDSRIVTSSGASMGSLSVSGTGGYQYTGSMDELRVYWGTVLTDKEMEALYMYPNGDSQGGGTIIEGGRIQTGKLQSNNWSAQSGSEFDLDDSRLRLGGSDSPDLYWEPLTNTLQVRGTIYIGDGSTLPDGSPVQQIKMISLQPSSNVYAFASSSDTSPDNNDITLTIHQGGMTAAVTKSDFSFTTANSQSLVISSSSMITSSFESGSGESTFVLSFNSSSTAPHLQGVKAALPISVTVTKDSRTDTTQIVALNGGVQGLDGASG